MERINVSQILSGFLSTKSQFRSAIILAVFGLVFSFAALQAQTTIGGNTPDPSAMLDVQSNSKGIVFPRMTASQRNAIASPATGLVIFNTDISSLEINLGTPASPSWQVIIRSCGAYVSAGVWKVFSCYNLGASNTSVDPLTPSWEINGGYWQWGRSAQAAPGPTGTGGSTPNDGVPSSWTPTGAAWNTTAAANGAWVDGFKTAADPCPTGYRVPTKSQWEGVKDATLNPQTLIGTWTAGATQYGSGRKFGNLLFLPTAGYRGNSSGALINRGGNGPYWSSTEGGAGNAWRLANNAAVLSMIDSQRTLGFSVRCVEE